ncbi:MAG: hypothetical protein GY853_05700 [PVC group bacterium]|nr:hypothetical protein [PVC group bacterium]
MSEEGEKKEEKEEKKEEAKEEKKDPYEHYKKKTDGSALTCKEELLNGPMTDSNRGCTDILFCIIFIVFLCAVLAVAAFGWWSGQPSKIFYFYDDDSRQCGLGVMSQYKYIYLYQTVSELKKVNSAFTSFAFCVKTCPSNYLQPIQCKPTTKKTDCLVTFENLYLSEPLVDRICVPSFKAYQAVDLSKPNSFNPYLYPGASAASAAAAQAKAQKDAGSVFSGNLINTDQLLAYIADVSATWEAIAASVGVAFIVALLYMLFLRCCAGFIAWMVIFIILILLTAIGYIFQARTLLYITEAERTTYIIMRVFSCLFYTAACVWLIFILANCNNIRLAIALIKVKIVNLYRQLPIT